MSEPKQTYKGMWQTVLSNEEGRTIITVEKTTKKSLLQWMKANKKE